jgi:GNAT superfamily N-acetyltransferase
LSITVRIGVAADADALAELAARTFEEAFGADNRPEDMALHKATAYGHDQQLRELVDPDVVTLLAEVDGQLGGFAQLRTGPAPECVTGESPIELLRLYVARAWHGQGLAQALMARVELEARLRRARTLWLGVWEKNPRAQAFYRKTGFTDVGSHVFMVGTDPQTDRIMARAIATRSG